jgi:hypothetical protein
MYVGISIIILGIVCTIGLALYKGISPIPESRVLHDVISPDGKWKCLVIIKPDTSGGSYILFGIEPYDSSGLPVTDGTRGRGDYIHINEQPESVLAEDFTVCWTSPNRVEISDLKTSRKYGVWQYEDGMWMDRRSWDDRTNTTRSGK